MKSKNLGGDLPPAAVFISLPEVPEELRHEVAWRRLYSTLAALGPVLAVVLLVWVLARAI